MTVWVSEAAAWVLSPAYWAWMLHVPGARGGPPAASPSESLKVPAALVVDVWTVADPGAGGW